MFKKLLLALVALFCITAQAAIPPGTVVKQGIPAVKARGEVKGHFKIRTASTVLGGNAAIAGDVAIKPQSPLKIPKAGDGVKMPDLVGSVVQSNSGLAVGIYSIDENGLNPIKTGYTMNASNGGAALDGKYICCFMDQFNGQVYGAYYRIFDMSDWTLVAQNYNADFDMMSECMTSDGSVIYGCFYNKELSGYELGTMSLDPVARTGTIRVITKPYSALACSPDALYGIYGDGTLVAIDRTTGDETVLSNTGIVSDYLTSAAFDTKSGLLYYASCNDSETALYSVDFNNGYSVSRICDLKGEVCGMHIIAPLAEDDAPAAVADLSVSFAKGSLQGNASFTMPSVRFGGGELAGDLSYKVMADNAEVAVGTAPAGSSVKADIQVAKAGMYKFTVITGNSAGNSPASNKVGMWVGPDKPFAPANVDIAYNDGKFNVTWDAVTSSVNSGYFDAERVKYTVTRYLNGVRDAVVADGISATQYDDAVAAPERLTIYTYKVFATFEGTASDETKSNAVVMGDIIPPYTNGFATADDFLPFTTIDANEDYATWNWHESGSALMGFSMDKDLDDWLMSAPVRLEAGKAYRLSVDARGESEYYTDIFEVRMGTGKGAADMSTELIGATQLTDAIYRTYYSLITPKATGTYYIGIHAMSKKNMGSVYIDNFTIEAAIDDAAPAIVENVKFTAQPDGSAAIDLSFNAPARSIAGAELASIAEIKVVRDGEVVRTFTDVAPAARLAFKDAVGTEKTVHYTITASNDHGEGVPFDKDAYAGLKLPATPVDCRIVESATTPGHVTVTWNPLAQDIDGDFINSDLITYTMVDKNQQIVATGLTAEDAVNGWSADVVLPEDGEQALAIYYIFAENRVGRNPVNGFTDMIPVGNPYTLPFKESCPDALLEHVWMNEGAFWGTAQSCYQPVCMPQDGDKGMFYLEPFLAKENNLLLSGKMLIPDSDNVGLSFYYCGTADDLFDIAPAVRIIGGDTYYLTEPIHTNSVGTGWQRVFVPLDAFKGKMVQVGVNVNARSQQDYFLLDNIEVREFAAHDVAVSDFSVPSTMTVGVDNKATVTVTNMGTNEAGNITLQLLAGDEVAETINIGSLGVSVKKTVELTVRPDVTQKSAISYRVKAVYDGDEDLSNNQSEVRTVEFTASRLPVVTIDGSVADRQVTLTWQAPVADATTEQVTDDLEDYDSFAIGNAGDYSFYDIDGDETFGLEGGIMFENQGQAMSYIVFDTKGVDDAYYDNVKGYAHSGSKCLAAFSSVSKGNDDWLISPELPGIAQTISFWHRSVNTNYGYDQFEILYSTTGNTPADFVKYDEAYASGLGWSKIEASLPEGTKYFAIRCISYQTLAWLIDDISYTRGTPGYTVIGYNIYRDGVKINDSVVTDTSYVDDLSEVSDADRHSYNVSAVYAEGESGLSNVYDANMSGVGSIAADNISITAGNGVIVVNGADNVTVYGIDGKTCATARGNAAIAVRPGFYIVKADNKVATVTVR